MAINRQLEWPKLRHRLDVMEQENRELQAENSRLRDALQAWVDSPGSGWSHHVYKQAVAALENPLTQTADSVL